MDQLLDSKAVAKNLGCSLDHLRSLDIPIVKLGRLVRYRWADVTAYIAKSTQGAVLNQEQDRPFSLERFAPFGVIEIEGQLIPRARLLRRVVVRERSRDVHLAVIACPFCGAEHRHGWETGLRVAHCRQRPAGAPSEYWIECPDDHPVAATR